MTGFINVNKAQGASSAKEVSIIKKLTKTPCGHMGTLDPMASGVLPVAIGNAARLFDYFLEKHKVYVAEFYFGATSDTLDTTGEVIYNVGRVPKEEEIVKVLQKFTGELLQMPPKYSAKCVGGKRGYQLARAGVEFELSPKKVTVYNIKLLERTGDSTCTFKIECGGGTYIRSLARDIGESLSTCAIMSSLIRTQSGVFTLENSVKSENLTAENIADYVIPTDSVLPYESIVLNDFQAKKLFNGLTVKTNLPEGLYKVYAPDKSFYGIGCINQSNLKIRTKLC